MTAGSPTLFCTGSASQARNPDQKKLPEEMTADEIMIAQGQAAELPLGKRIVYWAGRFIGTPYDTDPLGLYVRTNRIVADEKADCMYLTFRAVELARIADAGHRRLSRRSPSASSPRAGSPTGWCRTTASASSTARTWCSAASGGGTSPASWVQRRPSRARAAAMRSSSFPSSCSLSKKLQKQLQDGDIIYWVKDPKKRVVGGDRCPPVLCPHKEWKGISHPRRRAPRTASRSPAAAW